MSDNEKISPEKMRDLVVKIFLESGKSAEEFIADYEKWCRQKKKKEQLEARAKRQAALQSERERKQRTRHLIQLGGTVLSVLNRPYVNGDLERLDNFLKNPTIKDFFLSAMNEKNPLS